MKALRPYQQKAVNDCWDALKANDEPVLLMASVGAGKSLMIADILLTMQQSNKKVLCLVNNAELVRNNCETFVVQGGTGSIYCAALNKKDCSAAIVFGTPQSVLNGIKQQSDISLVTFNMIVVDEAHTINYLNQKTIFMQILRYYKQRYKPMRLLGATGTNFRFKGSAIVGDECLFKSQVGNITTEQLINDNYLIKPVFDIDKDLIIDFSKVKIKNGQFDKKELAGVVDKNTRLTALICKQVIHIIENQKRFGVFLFATTKKHAYEILSYLPPEESGLILGDTPQDERTQILDKARNGTIRYLVNIAIISVGIDIPAFDTIAYLRPTESLVLLVQTIGRALRLSKDTNKSNALVLDFAGNIDRHRDWDNPLLLDAIKQTLEKDKPLVIACPACNEMNTEDSRRCTGFHENKRCDYYFEFKACESCNIKNDITARYCRECHAEIIDPNKKLSLESIKQNLKTVKVLNATYKVTGEDDRFKINCIYQCLSENNKKGYVYESYSPTTEKGRRFFYGNFVKKHTPEASKWYMSLNNRKKIHDMLKEINTPESLLIYFSDNQYKIKNKIFL